MSKLTVGVANSVSANFQFDPIDTIKFAKQTNYEIVQIYLNESLLDQKRILSFLQKESPNFMATYFHAEGLLNEDFLKSSYRIKLYDFLESLDNPKYIIHFDENSNVDKLLKLVNTLSTEGINIYVENFFISPGKIETEKNLRKYLALFTLSNNFGNSIYPVLDIPRLFNREAGLSIEEGLEWCYQILNFFGNRQIPLLLHLIDSTSPEINRHHFTAVGSGCIPYKEIFHFMKKTRPKISGIILEFEDKIMPLQSREFINNYFGDF